MLRVLYHMQVVEHTRCSRKFIGKSFGEPKILHMGKNRDLSDLVKDFVLKFGVLAALRALSRNKSYSPSDS